ncbi:MAG: DUF4276 family protein [Reinekea sp.]
MSKKIGLIMEDKSDIEVIDQFLKKYMDESSFSIKKFIGNGCGKLKNKCDIWTKNLFDMGCYCVIIFHDLDRNNENDLREELLKKVPEKTYPKSLIVIPIEEIEAWLLSDEKAIKQVFNLKARPKKIANPETIKSPKEHIRDMVWRQGKKRYLNTVHNKRIASIITLDNLKRCPSYIPFHDFVTDNICT